MTRDDVLRFLDNSGAEYEILSDGTVLQTIRMFRDEEREVIVNHWGYQGNWNLPNCLTHSSSCKFV